MHGFVHMDTRTSWLLFVLTMFVHSATFVFLQSVANGFQQFKSATLGEGTTVAKNVKKDPVVQTPTKPLVAQSRYTMVQYQELHHTLDVSVFR